MASITFENIGISCIAAAVPQKKIINREYTQYFSSEIVNDIIDKTGVEERRFTEDGQTSADLCFAAAEKLIEDNQVDKSEIDILIFVSQTPDYRMPATSITLQHRLGLPKSTAAFDVNLGCSGFVYGLSIAYTYANMPNINKVLLLDGETRSKAYHPKDRKTGFIFGDAAVALIIEKNDKVGKSFFSLNSDGSKSHLIKIDAGGYRNPSSQDTIKEKVVDDQGSIRTDEHGYMNGADVFNFVIKEIPKNIKQTLNYANSTIDQCDYIVCHQANRFMNNYLVKKLKIDASKVPSTIEKYGNTSSVSIPITIVDQLKDKLVDTKKILLCGFGVGMSWATAIIHTNNIKISKVVEV